MENKTILFTEASDGEIKKLVYNSGTIKVRSPSEIIRRFIKQINPFPARWLYRRIMPTAETEIVLKISQLPSKLRFSANCSFFGQSCNLSRLSSDIPAAERGLFTKYFQWYFV